MVDKRKHPRRSVQLVARYISAKTNEEGHVRDLSPGGLFFSSDQLDNPGDPATVWLEIPQREGRLQLQGQVRWTSREPERQGMGIQFLNLTPETETLLTQLPG